MGVVATMKLDELFHAALAMPPAERVSFLASTCRGDEPMRHRVEELLQAHDNPGSFLVNKPNAGDQTIDGQLGTESPGTLIGPYKLLELIGEGGFGVVYLAEQSEPVRRKVALKVLKPGMDTRQI